MSLSEYEAESPVLQRTIDVDTHEMAPTHVWSQMFGEQTARFGDLTESFFRKLTGNCPIQPGLVDCAPISAEAVWELRGPEAPGAFDFERRLEVLDTMGTRRQLVFPTAALSAFAALYDSPALRQQIFGLDDSPETEAMLRGVCDEYNGWTLRTTAAHGDRYRPAAMLFATTVEELISHARRLIEAGARALWLPTSAPPAGRSPADPALGPLWATAEEADVPVVLHLGTEFGFRASEQWSKAPAFHPEKVDSNEISFEPFSATTLYMVPSAYLTALVMGGVFEKYPRLRFGVIELGSSWLGPLAEHLDVWAAHPFKKRMATILSMAPSAYFARNVRVTPFYFEPVDVYLDRWPQLHHCFCYGTDYPHVEGGRHTKERFYEMVKPFGADLVEQFFVRNGEWLVPD